MCFQLAMLTLRCCIVDIMTLVLLGVMCTYALPSVPDYNDDHFSYRDESEALPTDPRKPVREDGELLQETLYIKYLDV